MENKSLVVGDVNTSKKDSKAIIERICKEHPGITVAEYLKLVGKDNVRLL
jgi:hypothetical protein